VEGGAEELDPAGAMASMESRMEARKSGLARRGSGGDDGRRGYRYPSGRYRHWPGTAASVGNVVAALGCFPSALCSLRSVGFVGEGFGSGQLGRPCPGPPPILYSAGDGGPPAIMTGRPRSGRDQRGFGPIFGSGLEIISNILPLDLSFSYSCSLSEFGSSHRRSVYRACLVMTVITVRLTATITFLV